MPLPQALAGLLVFRLIHLDPALTMAMAFLARRCEARRGLAFAVHVKGFGVWLRCSIHSSIAASSSATLCEDASADALARDLGEEPLDEIEPRTGCRREMQLETLVPGEPALHLLCLVRGVIVDDQMQIEMGGRLAVDLPQERQEFVRPVAWQTFADDLASRHIKRGEERCRAV